MTNVGRLGRVGWLHSRRHWRGCLGLHPQPVLAKRLVSETDDLIGLDVVTTRCASWSGSPVSRWCAERQSQSRAARRRATARSTAAAGARQGFEGRNRLRELGQGPSAGTRPAIIPPDPTRHDGGVQIQRLGAPRSGTIAELTSQGTVRYSYARQRFRSRRPPTATSRTYRRPPTTAIDDARAALRS